MEAITREEKLMDGQYVEPITRKEKILAGEDLETITREEYFLKKYRGGGGGATVEPLSVTENGTYTAPTGKAYSPVTVNVEGYAKKSIANTPTPIATFNASALPMPSLKIGIEPVQSGSGDPSPTNVRPFSGWSAVNVYKSGVNIWDEEWRIDGAQFKAKNLISVMPNTSYYFKRPSGAYSAFKYDINGTSLGAILLPENAVFTTDSETYYIWFSLSVNDYGTTYNNDISINYPSTDTDYHAYNGTTYTTQLKDGQGNPMTCYGGELVNENGVQRLDNGKDIRLVSECTWQGSNGAFYTNSVASSIKHGDGKFDHVTSSAYKTENVGSITPLSDGAISVDADGYIQIKDSRYSTAGDFKSNMGTTQLVYELATPQQIPQDNLPISTQDGTNNIWADTGDVLEGSYFKSI